MPSWSFPQNDTYSKGILVYIFMASHNKTFYRVIKASEHEMNRCDIYAQL